MALYGMQLMIALCVVRVGGVELLVCRSNARTLLDSSVLLAGARAGDGHS